MKKNQVKVTKTEPYKDSQAETIVCKGKLVLIPMINNTGGKEADEFIWVDTDSIKGNWYKPMIISETEQVEDWDSKLTSTNKIITSLVPLSEGEYKILVLPENFSPKHLQAIADGKLKDGDEVFVECEEKTVPKRRIDWDYVYNIKLDKVDHVTLFPVKRANKMVDKLDIYSGDLNAERIKTYKELAKAYNVQEGTVRDIFCKGAEWVIDVSERI